MLNNLGDQLTFPADFACCLLSDNQLFPNVYSIQIGLEPISVGHEALDVGFKKIKFFINEYLRNSIVLNQNSELVNALQPLNTNLLLLPDEPYDFLVASILYKKFSAILYDCFNVNFLGIDSTSGDHVAYTITEMTNGITGLDGDFWWNQDTMYTGVSESTTWEDLGLAVIQKNKPVVVKGGLSES